MGREATLLLALLGLLAGALAGVVSMKLFVPRPPVGAGPDIHHGDLTATEDQELVEPPPLALPPVATPPAATDAAVLPASRFSRAVAPPADQVGDPQPGVRDPFVAPASFSTATADNLLPPAETLASADLLRPADALPPPAASIPPAEPAPAATSRGSAATDDLLPPPGFTATEFAVPSPPADSLARFPTAESAAASPTPGFAAADSATYVAQPGDSWWSLAEQTYGDGRLYRALFAWNRDRDPRVSLVPGTRLELPPRDRLSVAWPALMPRE